MRRWHLIEIEDLPFLPTSVRNLLTDVLAFLSTRLKIYRPVLPLLEDVLVKMGTRRIIDLCSGAAGPWPKLLDDGLDVSVTLTDKYPNRAAMSLAQRQHPERITIREDPVDARALPADCAGVCTMFNGFHHFPPAEAKAILQSLVQRRKAIAVFEITEASPRIFLSVLCVPILMLLITPWLRPLTWERLFWTYLIPLAPLCLLWDGLVSMLRIYSQQDLQQLAAATDSPGYAWKTGRLTPPFPGLPITYLIGYPQAEEQSRQQDVPTAEASTATTPQSETANT
ncbi:MAG: class I SAM-dependent methyltransferase [Desulfuromonadales bacterium]|jgi:hypothetical protein